MAIQKIKIAFFADILRENQDGVTHTIFQIAHNVDPDKVDYLFVTPEPPQDCQRFPFPIITIPGIAFPLYKDYPIAIPWFNNDLKAALNQFKPDILHFVAPFTLGLWALHYGKKKHIPVVASYHTHFVSYIDYYLKSLYGLPRISETIAKRYMAWFYNQCAMALVPTANILDELLTWGIGKNRLTLWGRGIDTQKFNPAFQDRAFIDILTGQGKKGSFLLVGSCGKKRSKPLSEYIGIFVSNGLISPWSSPEMGRRDPKCSNGCPGLSLPVS